MKKRIAFYTAFTALLGWGHQAAAQTTDTVQPLVLVPRDEINIGFARQARKHVTSAVSAIGGADLRKQFTTSVANTLTGRVAGLTVNVGSNEPGSTSPAMFIRGLNTYGFSAAPLVVIDGIIGDHTHLVPDEIEQVTVLKDASATAVYGMRGANGVLLITTKKGSRGPLKISLTGQYGFQEATALPKFLDAYNYASLFNEALSNDGRPAQYTQNDLDLYRSGNDQVFHPNVSWYDKVLRQRAPLANYTANFSGGDNTVRYFVMLNALTSQGLYKKFGDDFDESANPSYNRYNLRSNLEVTISKIFSAQLNIGGSIGNTKNPGDLTISNNFTLMDRLAPNAFPVTNPDGSIGGNNANNNPVANLTNTGYSSSNGSVLQSSFSMSANLDTWVKGLSASALVSFNNYYNAASNKRRSYQRFSVAKNAAGDTVYTGFGQNTSLSPEEFVLNQAQIFGLQGYLNYNRNFGVHGLTAMLMFNTDHSTVNKAYPNTDAANQSFPFKTNGGATRITYINNNRYIAEFSGGLTGTENFPEDSRYGFFPAGSIGWIASNEPFLQKNKLLSFLKLRASYGLVGNEAIGGQRFMFTQRYPSGASYYLGTGNTQVFSVSEGRRLNEDVTWEKEKKANLGVDADFFNGFGFSVDVFHNSRYDILSSASGTLPSFLGYNGLPDLNIGTVENRGFEAVIRYNSKEGKAFRFFAEANIFYAKNKITDNGEPVQLNSNLYRSGSAIGQPFVLESLGLFQSDAEIAGSPKPLGIAIRPGDIKYRDIGGPAGVPDGIIDGNDATAIGYSETPQWTAGLHTGFRYKGFDLDLFFQGITGITRYLGGARYHAFQENGQVAEIALNRWTPQNTVTAEYPRLSANNNLNNYRTSSYWQRDGSFIKLRSAEIGYTLPEKAMKKIHLTQTRVFLNGTNLLTLDKISEGDSEALTGYPSMKTLSLGLRINL
ncbi:SusC/RagA family TonB-linked outer membrane protein [Flavitalea antarctica]